MKLKSLLARLFYGGIVFALTLPAVAKVTPEDKVKQEDKMTQEEEKGLRIAKEMKIRDSGWGDSVQEAVMVLTNASGEESSLKLNFKTLEVENEGDKSLTFFTYPLDVKGTALLNYTYTQRPDDKWLYLPALKRVKRITSKAKSGPFMGSEFAYEDLNSFEVERYRYKYLREEKVDGQDRFVVEYRPKDKYTGYSKQLVWIDKEHYRVYRVDYYDKKQKILKTEVSSDYRLYMDKYWRPHRIDILNNQTGKKTSLIVDTIKFQNNFEESDFSQASLKRIR
jgi:outer membrane lipoprotein-sorting protein